MNDFRRSEQPVVSKADDELREMLADVLRAGAEYGRSGRYFAGKSDIDKAMQLIQTRDKQRDIETRTQVQQDLLELGGNLAITKPHPKWGQNRSAGFREGLDYARSKISEYYKRLEALKKEGK